MSRPAIRLTYPDRYSESDFMDIVSPLIKESLPHVSGGTITMSAFNKQVEFKKFGKSFELSLCIVCGNAIIDIKEV
jgi:hypothetical protein